MTNWVDSPFYCCILTPVVLKQTERTFVDTYIGLVTFVLGCATLMFLRRQPQRQPLFFEDLETLLEEVVEVGEQPQGKPLGTEVSVLLRCGPTRVLYDRCRVRGKQVETVDIAVWQKVGFILTFEEEEIITFTRSGSEPTYNPEIAARDYNKAADFLRRVRKAAEMFAEVNGFTEVGVLTTEV